jgi:hypothetical protein
VNRSVWVIVWHGIITSLAPRLTAHQPFRCQPCAGYKAALLQCIDAVLRARRRKSTPAPKPRAQSKLIGPDQHDQQCAELFVQPRETGHDVNAARSSLFHKTDKSSLTRALSIWSAAARAKTTKSRGTESPVSLKCSRTSLLMRFRWLALRICFFATMIPSREDSASVTCANKRKARLLTL